MKILIAGATGLVGKALLKQLSATHDVAVLSRSKAGAEKIFPTVTVHTWQEFTDAVPSWFASYDAVINLSGANIADRRWSESAKQEILHSRVNATATLATACAELGDAAPWLLNASAIGIYGLQETVEQQANTVFTEDSALPQSATDFLAEVGTAWEAALLPAQQAGVAVTTLRFAVVLSKSGGVLAKLLPSFRVGLGAVVGSGQQPMSWIALPDLVRLVEFVLQQRVTGVVNCVAPEVVSQRTFAKTLASVLHRPCWLRLPAWLVRVMFGQMGQELLLSGIAVHSKVLQSRGFEFHYADVKTAFINLLNNQGNDHV